MTSKISGDFLHGVPITCILNEGTITVGTGYNEVGHKTTNLSFADELHKNEIVALCPDSACTYENTAGLPVVEPVADGDSVIVGIIESEPLLQKKPGSTGAADTLEERLAGEYYRVATVRFFTFSAIAPATLVTTDTAVVTPGVAGKLKVDVSESTGGENGIVLNDVGSGGTGIVPLHYQAKTAGATVKILVAVTGMMTGAT